MKAKVNIERASDGTYQCYISEGQLPFGVIGVGATVKKAIVDFHSAHEAMKEHYKEMGGVFPEVTYDFAYDMPSFLQHYAYAFSLAGLERITGVHQKQLWHYLNGIKKPRAVTVRKIEARIRNFGSEIASVDFT